MFLRFFIILLIVTNISFASENINTLINGDLKVQAIVGSVTKIIPLNGGFSGDEVYLVNDRFVIKRFKVYNPKAIEIQKQASILSIAPKIFYENHQKNFVLMEFLRKSPEQLGHKNIKKIAHLLKTLHKITPASDMLLADPFEKVHNILLFLQGKNINKDILGKFSKVLSLKKHDNYNRAICHNDLNPNNFLFVNDKAMAIDWYTSGLNDPYYDLATIAMWYITVPEIDKKLLKEYLDRDPKRSELEHLNFMKTVAIARTGGNLIKAGINMGCKIQPETPSDSLIEFLPKIFKGEIKLDSGRELYDFGLILLKEIKEI